MSDLKFIIHQRLMWIGREGYTVNQLQQELAPSSAPSAQLVYETLQTLIKEGIAGEDNKVFKLIGNMEKKNVG